MEEIKIDGVDVSGCELIYNDGRCFASQRQGVGYPYHKNDYCKYNPNCYYEQLKRKEKECEELYKEKDKLNLIIDRLLEASGYNKDTCSDYDFENVYSDMGYKVNKLEEYKQALQEIKKQIDMCENGNCLDCKYEDCDDCTSLAYTDILQKISEVEE